MIDFEFSEFDFLVFFYLQESGYLHSAFTFSHESKLDYLFKNKEIVPPGLLVSLVQRGIMFSKLETMSSPIFRGNVRSPVDNLIFDKPFMSSNSLVLKKKKKFSKEFFLFYHDYSIYTYSWHPRQLNFFFGTRDSKVFSWKINLEKKKKENKKEFFQIDLQDKFSKKIDVIALDINMSGTVISFGLLNGEIVFLTETGRILKKTIVMEGSIFEIKWSEDSRLMIISVGSGDVMVWSSWKNQFLSIISVYKTPVLSLKWCNKNRFLSFSKKWLNCCFDISLKKSKLYRVHFLNLSEISLSMDKRLGALCSDDKTISIWLFEGVFVFHNFLIGHKKEISGVKWKPHALYKFGRKKNNFLCSWSLDFCLRIWLINEKKIQTFSILKIGPFLSLSWNSLGEKLFLFFPTEKVLVLNKGRKIFRRWSCTNPSIFNITSHPINNRKGGLAGKAIICL